MEGNPPAKPAMVVMPNITKENDIKEVKSYNLKLNDEIYEVTMELYSNEKITFKVKQANTISYINYIKTYKYEELLSSFLLTKDYYNDATKIFKYFDKSMTKDKIRLSKDNNKLKLILKKTIDYEDIECTIQLEEKKITTDELIKILLNEIKVIKQYMTNEETKTKDNNLEEEMKNIKENEENMEKKIKEIIELIEKLQKEIQETKHETNQENKMNKIKEEIEIQKKEKEEIKQNLEKQVKEMKEEYEKFKQDYNNVKNNMVNMETKINQIKENNEKIIKEKEDNKQELKQNQEKMEKNIKDIEQKLFQNNQNLINQINTMNNNMNQMIEKYNDIKKDLMEIKEENKKIKEDNNKINQQINELNNNKVNIENKLNIITEENKKLKKDNEELLLKQQELKNNINTIKEDNNKLKSEIQELKTKIENLEKDMNIIKEINNKITKDNDDINNQIKIMKEEIKKNRKEEKMNNENIEFKGNPENLKLKENITNNHSITGALCQFDVYIGIKDNIEYIVYNNKNNYNIEIMRIKEKRIINTLKGHNTNVRVIRYYKKENKEEYILSSDKNKLNIIWDIENNYNIKYKIKIEYKGYIYDAILLFNIYNKNYIILSSGNVNEYSKLYELKENIEFNKDIYGTKENKTYYLIPWLYKNKYYIIECCYNKISINNIR